MRNRILPGTTESVCPECLKRIPAEKIIDGGRVYLVKSCPEHGEYRVLIWEGGPAYESWATTKIPSSPAVCRTEVQRGCPYDCGLCPDHRQETCCVLLEITQRCNLCCPVCFASANNNFSADPDLAEIESWYRLLLEGGGPYNIQLSGGEPALRDDLPAIIRMGRELGFDFIQLNTNGVRLALEPGFVKELKEAGLSCVFLQFDGTTDEIYRQIRGAAVLDLKKLAIAGCAREGIGVVLVPTLVPGVNMDNLGEIIRFAITQMPTVRGVHFQPVSYFGRYPKAPPVRRITIPEVLRALESQTAGQLKSDNFLPASAENAYCSFHGNFILMPGGELKPWSSFETIRTSQAGQSCCKPLMAAEELKKGREFVARQWAAPQNANRPALGGCSSQGVEDGRQSGINTSSLDQFLERISEYTLAISGMAFQDAWTLDLERLRECKIHVVSPDKRIIPFCAYNLTTRNGKSLYRGLGVRV